MATWQERLELVELQLELSAQQKGQLIAIITQMSEADRALFINPDLKVAKAAVLERLRGGKWLATR